MRIIGNIDHPQLKITLFKMDNKFSIKFESGLYEQTYKFRITEGLETAEDLRKLVDQDFLEAVLRQLSAMHRSKTQALSRLLPPVAEDEFEKII